MQKKHQLNLWFWKWHFIAGLISLPFIVLLSITGGIYLFKANYETPIYAPTTTVVAEGTALSYQEQYQLAKQHAPKKLNAMVVPQKATDATAFSSGRFGGKTSLYIDPYKKEVTGHILPKESLMYTVQKLHGELLLGKFGTTIVELIASWMVVLLITGLYIWWPANGWSLKGFFVPRIKQGKRLFYRDLHAISGFWISGLLLLVLAGGFPWTDTFGSNFKWVQKVTHTGYPSTWQGRGVTSSTIETTKQQPLPLDAIVAMAKKMELPGEVTIQFPKGKKGVYSISNNHIPDQKRQVMIHLDQYSGKPVLQHQWSDVGFLMRGRMWVMAFHQGEFGLWNWWLMLFVAILLALMSLSAMVSYILRKQKGNWGVPKVPKSFVVSYGLIALLIVLGLIFPLFGISLIILFLYEKFGKKRISTTKNVLG